MREIKFRAKHKKDGSWHYGTSDLNKVDWSENIRILEYFFGLVKSGILDKSTLGQFIGHQDKSDKDVYEWDILRHGAGLYKVIFKNGSWQGEPIKNCSLGCIVTTRIYTGIKKKEFEVVGNVDDNAELLVKK